jgi:hypothetical protein
MKDWQKNLIEKPSEYIKSMFSQEEWEHIVLNELEEPSFGGPSIYQNDFYKKCMMDLYGVEHPMHHPDFVKKNKESYVKTCMEKYGVENTSQLQEIKEKISKTVSVFQKENPSFGRGLNNIMKRTEVQEKNKQTCIERYGFQRASENQEIKEKIGSKSRERAGRVIVEEIKHLRKKHNLKLPRSWNHMNTEFLQLLKEEINDKYS